MLLEKYVDPQHPSFKDKAVLHSGRLERSPSLRCFLGCQDLRGKSHPTEAQKRNLTQRDLNLSRKLKNGPRVSAVLVPARVSESAPTGCFTSVGGQSESSTVQLSVTK